MLASDHLQGGVEKREEARKEGAFSQGSDDRDINGEEACFPRVCYLRSGHFGEKKEGRENDNVECERS